MKAKLIFYEVEDKTKPRTKVYEVDTIRTQRTETKHLGTIEFSVPHHEYIFLPNNNVLLKQNYLIEISEFMEKIR